MIGLKSILSAQIKRKYDPDAASYIASVETADGQSLESGVKDAITEFIINLKIRGLWDSINGCLLLCGARTLTGALIPLKGSAPTNINFVAADYNRETGLKGNGTSKYINTNMSPNLVGQNNTHFSIYVTSPNSYDASRNYICAGDGSPSMLYRTLSGAVSQISCNTAFGSNGSVANMLFIGCNRENSDSFTLRVNNNNITFSTASTSVPTLPYFLFSRRGNGSPLEYANGRIMFFSMGQGLNLKLLQDSISQLRRSILQATAGTYSFADVDAANYVSRVELAENFPLETKVKQAFDIFIAGLKTDNIWTPIKSCCIMAGAKTMDGALTPLLGNRPLIYGFNPEVNYSRSLGLIGTNNGGTVLYPYRLNNEDPQDDNHCATYISSSQDLNWYFGTPSILGGIGLGARGQASSLLMTVCRNSGTTAVDSSGSLNRPGFIGVARNSSLSYIIRGNKTNETIAVASSTPIGEQIGFFGKGYSGTNSSTGARLSFYSIGRYLDLSLLDARLVTLMSSLSSAEI